MHGWSPGIWYERFFFFLLDREYFCALGVETLFLCG